MKKELAAGVIIYKIDDFGEPNFLILKHRQGHWSFAKGKMEEGESFLQTALREVLEETNIRVDVYKNFKTKLDYTYKNNVGELIKKAVTYFVGNVSKDCKVTLSSEHLEYVWLSLKGSLEKLTYQSSKNILYKTGLFIATL